jgi:hypothetical protein
VVNCVYYNNEGKTVNKTKLNSEVGYNKKPQITKKVKQEKKQFNQLDAVIEKL